MDEVELFAKLDEKTKAECPVCGQDKGFTSDAVKYALQPLDEAAEPVNHGKPLLSFMCQNCGFVRLHHPFPLERDASSQEKNAG